MKSLTNIQRFSSLPVALLSLVVVGCTSPTPAIVAEAPTLSQTTAPSPTPSETPTPTNTVTSTPTPTLTPTPSITPTPTVTPTLTITPTPTFDFPKATIIMQANCRYGPGVAYMWSHGLYPGDTAIIHNRNRDGSWLWIKPSTLNRHCWASEIVMDIEGDVFTVVEYYHPLPHTTFIGPAKNVQASRSGNQVTVTWDPVYYVPAYDLRGYLLEVRLCQNGSRFSTTVHTEGTSYTFTDDTDCSGSSSGKLWAAEKHGYADPVQIPWP